MCNLISAGNSGTCGAPTSDFLVGATFGEGNDWIKCTENLQWESGSYFDITF